MPTAGSGDLSPNGDEIVYSPQSRDFRSEKRYGGGQANQLYIFNLKSNAAKHITEGPRPTRDPMWIGDTIYFNSDRDGHFNLYAYNVPNGRTTQVTTSRLVGCALAQLRQRRPDCLRDGRRTCQVMDARSKKSTPISINVPDEGNCTPAESRVGVKFDRVSGSESERRTRFVCSSRRHLHSSDRKRSDSKSD